MCQNNTVAGLIHIKKTYKRQIDEICQTKKIIVQEGQENFEKEQNHIYDFILENGSE